MTLAICITQIPQFTSQDFAFSGNKLAWIAVAYAAAFAFAEGPQSVSAYHT